MWIYFLMGLSEIELLFVIVSLSLTFDSVASTCIRGFDYVAKMFHRTGWVKLGCKCE